ncbi:hypothetical protein Ddye_001111 [Dipteronia dyeriana]|uniref:peroxidase n=1 Tax=Dipteronia dyeriana TaxID=168575 RepID=A0AAD9XNP2_9ROSI|nr:hypothetical protein Ddye_001111 [Dipteronia dyeriana]
MGARHGPNGSWGRAGLPCHTPGQQIFSGTPQTKGQLKVGFYSKTCPTAESIVHSVVEQSIKDNTGNAAVLPRLQFHDCFCCDGSIPIKVDGGEGEQAAPRNLGFEIIEEAKTSVEAAPRSCLCANIVSLAARNKSLFRIPKMRLVAYTESCILKMKTEKTRPVG